MMKAIIVLLLITGIPSICACGGDVWACVRTDVASNLTNILLSDTWNLTQDGRIVVERIRDSNVRLENVPSDVGFSSLIRDSIRIFDTHQLLWRVIPGIVDVKIFKHDGEGMDFGVDMPGSEDGRTWRVGAMRRRITMALLPIMYKLGVGTTLLGVLVFIAIKTAAMVSVLFVLAIGSFAKHKLGVTTPPPPTPHAVPVQKEVHVHVHADPHKQPDHHWLRKPPHEEYEPVDPLYSYGFGSSSSYDEPQVLHQAPFRRWPTSRLSTVRLSSPWSPSQAHLTGTLPPSAHDPVNPRWTWQRYKDQEPPFNLAKTLQSR